MMDKAPPPLKKMSFSFSRAMFSVLDLLTFEDVDDGLS
jgi:hypothetical protein